MEYIYRMLCKMPTCCEILHSHPIGSQQDKTAQNGFGSLGKSQAQNSESYLFIRNPGQAQRGTCKYAKPAHGVSPPRSALSGAAVEEVATKSARGTSRDHSPHEHFRVVGWRDNDRNLNNDNTARTSNSTQNNNENGASN